jgi:hemolysin activation/secretion protein
MLNPSEQMPGKTDLIVGVEERIPLRLAVSFDDSGAEVIGKNHYTTMLQYGNVLGFDHQATYQFVTTDHSKVYQAHALDYRIPLRSRHYLQLMGSLSRARPTFGAGLFSQDAKNVGAGLRYTIPLRGGDNALDWYAALDFKQSNNNLEYGGLQIINNKTDLYHVGTGLSWVRRDKTGAWMIGANTMFSPGHINNRNTTATLQNARLGAAQTYLYGNLSLQRLINLGKGWDVVARFFGQLSSSNLLGSEQITIGGSGTVRGFGERIFAGDQGFVFSNEVILPAWKTLLPFIKNKKRPPLETRLLVFYDVGHAAYQHSYPADLRFSPLASTGLGLRMTLPANFGLTFDYGWQITTTDRPTERHSGGHLKATLAF